MYDQLLIPTDGSHAAERALNHGIDLAAQNDARVHVLAVAETNSISSFESISGTTVDSIRAETESMVNDAAGRVESAGVDVVAETREGRPAEVIVDYAAEHDIDLIVMGTHGRQGVERAMLGSVTERVVRSSPVPVLTLRDDED